MLTGLMSQPLVSRLPAQGRPVALRQRLLDEGFVEAALAQKMLLFTPFGASVVQEEINALGAPPAHLCDFGYSEEQILAMGFVTGCSAASDP